MPYADVVIVHLADSRVGDAIQSCLAQPNVCHVILADGGSPRGALDDVAHRFAHEPRLRILPLPGTVAQTRSKVLAYVDAPVLAFLDADQQGPPNWLPTLVEPLLNGFDQTCGPTRPPRPPGGPIERYLERAERSLYEAAATDPRLFPAGNSAWRLAALQQIGGFDAASGRAGEDYDLNVRAHRAGLRCGFVSSAWVYHDQSHIRTWRQVLWRKYVYFEAAAFAYHRRGVATERAAASAQRMRFRHWIDLADLVLKPLAFLRARRRHQRTVLNRRADAPDAAKRADTVK